jgi:hypothetical protein
MMWCPSFVYLLTAALLAPAAALGHAASAQFHVVAIAEAGGIHKPFVDAAKT